MKHLQTALLPHSKGDRSLGYLCFLADWKHVLLHGRQITEARWIMGGCGPHPEGWWDSVPSRPLSLHALETVKLVIERAAVLERWEQCRLVYSTWPVMTTPRWDPMDLVQLAKAKVQFELDGSSVAL